MSDDKRDYQIERLERQVSDLQEDVGALLKEMARYKGFVGGVIFIFSCLTAGIAVLYQWLRIKAGG